MIMRFRDRTDAGQQLAGRLEAYSYRPDVLVLGLPRGGVPVAFMVATALHVPMDILLVRKLGVPGAEELALGAIASGGREANGGEGALVQVLNKDLIRARHIAQAAIRQVIRREQQELERRERAYRADRPFPSITKRIVILADDGLATGATMWAAVAVVRQHQPARVVVAVPVGDHTACMALRGDADEVLCVWEPEPLGAVAAWYQEFAPTSEDELKRVLDRMQARAWHFQQAPELGDS
jgi:putative phosphoribosyl transferase